MLVAKKAISQKAEVWLLTLDLFPGGRVNRTKVYNTNTEALPTKLPPIGSKCYSTKSRFSVRYRGLGLE
jgi:hypothetical protein